MIAILKISGKIEGFNKKEEKFLYATMYAESCKTRPLIVPSFARIRNLQLIFI